MSLPKAIDPPEKVTKLDAARRQLRSAVRMFFERRDPISIYTLTMAAHGILHDLCKAKGIASSLKDNDRVKPEYRKEWINIIHEPQNFFKHASRDSDPNATIEFQPELTPIWLMDAFRLYRQLAGQPLREDFIFQFWFGLAYPDLMIDGPMTRVISERLKNFNPANRDAFLAALNKAKLFPGFPGMD